ncbi:hypothetical protein [Primorskyibacter flagellatus]|uniref:hypothetical protein n=2 Tax=Primorskyibacter TaxID=1068904 RepID=UPI003A907C5E
MIIKAWGLMSDGGTIWDEDPTPEVSVTINMTRSDHRVAPEAVFFDTDLSGFDTNTASGIEDYDPSYHDKVYLWDYGESYRYTAPTQVIAMDAADGGNRTDSRYSRGPLGAHVFRTPGQHTVRLVVIEPSSGKVGFGTIQISVGDPDAFHAGRSTLFVDTTGGFRNAPDGAQRFKSLTSAFAALNAAVTPHRIVMERGQTHTISEPLVFRPPANAAGVSLRIEALAGTDARPAIKASDNFSGDQLILDRTYFDGSGFDAGSTFKGLELRGTWDVTTETGDWGINGITFGDFKANHCLMDDCVIMNVNTGVRTLNLRAAIRNNRIICVNDTIVSDWSNYGWLDGEHSHTCILGSRFAQNPDAISGGDQGGGHNNHGPYRVGAPNTTILLASDFFSATGWSLIRSIRAVQPAIRWNTSPAKGLSSQLNMQNCAAESADAPIVISAASANESSRVVNAIIEGTLVIGGFNARRLIGVTHGGLTIRNNVLVFSNTEYDATPIGGQSRRPDAFVRTPTNGVGGGTDTVNLTAPMNIYNNTLINLSDAGTADVYQDVKMGFETWNVVNNLIHEPNAGTPNTPYTPLTSSVAFTPRYKGYRPDASTLYTAYANPTDSASIWAPEIGSPALGAALKDPNACTDFRGNLRPEPPSIGAVEAD